MYNKFIHSLSPVKDRPNWHLESLKVQDLLGLFLFTLFVLWLEEWGLCCVQLLPWAATGCPLGYNNVGWLTAEWGGCESLLEILAWSRFVSMINVAIYSAPLEEPTGMWTFGAFSVKWRNLRGQADSQQLPPPSPITVVFLIQTSRQKSHAWIGVIMGWGANAVCSV